MHKKDKPFDFEIFDKVKSDSSKITSDELNEVLSNKDQISKKVSKLNFDRFSKLIRQLTLSLQMLKDYKTKAYVDIPWRTIALVVAAILYFINPFDIIPDFIPFIGYMDDVVAFAAIFKSAQTDLINYCKWKGYNMEEYF
jgi:uncharacterized membrane protein YkvA (DUF1232 family)